MTTVSTFTRHNWRAPDGETFSYSLWKPEPVAGQEPRAVMVGVHGLSGAALDYEPLGGHLVPFGYVTFALELRGQGNDPRPERRGDLAQVEEWFRDLTAFFALVRESYPGVPIYYYGESMGAALLVRFLAQAGAGEPPAGLILASPVVALPGRPSWWHRQLVRFFLLVRPTHRINVRKMAKRDKQPRLVTRDEAHRKWFETASHKLDRFTIRFFKCLHDLIEGCFAVAPQIRVPVLVIYAGHDIFIQPAKVEEFFARLGGSDKEIHFFPESYHLLLHDHDRALALARIEAWLLKRS